MAALVLNVGMYLGRFTHGLDASGRIMIPKAWRPADPDTNFAVLPWPVLGEADHVLVLSQDRWGKLLETLSQKVSLMDDEEGHIERQLAGKLALMKLDKIGRLCLGEQLAQTIGTKDEAVLIGRMDKFEIWNPDRLKQAEADMTAKIDPNAFKKFL